MASALFKPSRIVSVLILLGAAGWIASGAFAPSAHEGEPEEAPAAAAPPVPVQRVTVASATPEEHQRHITLSCTTEADHSSVAVARASGIITELDVERGDLVSAGQVIAMLSDEGRQAAVLQAQALLDQRIAEYEANKSLIDKGQAPKNQLPALEAAVASSARRPSSTSTPWARRVPAPPPATGLGSVTAATTRAMPLRMRASVHGPVRPVWLQGSIVTMAVAPRARAPASASALTSACGPPA